MNYLSYLDPAAIKAQSAAAITELDNDLDDLSVTKKAITAFMNESELKGDAYTELKKSMKQYRFYIRKLQDANRADIADHNTLTATVGDEVLDGQVIKYNEKKAWDSKVSNENKARFHRDAASRTSDFISREYHSAMAWSYDRLAGLDYSRYKHWLTKEEKYDAIELATQKLFQSGCELRLACLADPNNPKSVGLSLGKDGSDIMDYLSKGATYNGVYDDKGTYGGDQGDGIYNEFDNEDLYNFVRQHEGYENYTDEEIAELLKELNGEGCGYVGGANSIFSQYEGRPEEFEEKFGFPMFDENGDYNFTKLVVDYYLTTDDKYYLNENTGFSALRIEKIKYYKDHPEEFKEKFGIDILDDEGETSSEARELIDEYIRNNCGDVYTNPYEDNENGGTTSLTSRNRLTHYLAEKGVELSYESEYYDEDEKIDLNKVNNHLTEGKEVMIGTYNFTLYNEDGSKYSEKPVEGGHYMSVTGVTEDGRLVVSSWGKKYYLDPNESPIDVVEVIDVYTEGEEHEK